MLHFFAEYLWVWLLILFVMDGPFIWSNEQEEECGNDICPTTFGAIVRTIGFLLLIAAVIVGLIGKIVAAF